MSSHGYITGEYVPEMSGLSGGPENSLSVGGSSAGYGGANAISGDKLVRVCCRLGRKIVYGKDQSIKGWKSVYLKITHPTTTGADVSFKVEAVENSGTNTSEETYIMLYGPAPGGGFIDYRNVPVLPIYE